MKLNRKVREETTSAVRTGRRIRNIRNVVGITQKELGEKIGLEANRIQQYENGVRKPKRELCKKIADVLGVNVNALLEPWLDNPVGVMYALFEMETMFDLEVEVDEGKISICFNDYPIGEESHMLFKNLMAWYERRTLLQDELTCAESEEEKEKAIYEYNMWEWNFSGKGEGMESISTCFRERRRAAGDGGLRGIKSP